MVDTNIPPSEPPPETVKVAPPKPMDWPAALKHLHAIEQKAMMTHGKEGHNPIIWCRDNIRGIQTKLEANDKSRELYDSIMALQLDKVDTTLVKKTSHDVGHYKRPVMETVTIVQERKV